MKIGVFDSGVGGLTVLRALLPRIPDAEYFYLGDTARLPYGSKSQATIARYAVSSSQFLIDQGCEFLVIACNTASALALDEIGLTAAPYAVPVVGVITPGAAAAAAISQTRDTLVIATSATVESHAYSAACESHGLRSIEKACPLLVPLVEEGWIDHPVTAEVTRIYLSELHRQASNASLVPDTLVLGCTHYPLLREVFEAGVRELWPGHPAAVIDSAEATAREVERQLNASFSNRPAAGIRSPATRFYATDSVVKFRQLGTRFLNQPISDVELVDLGG
ncbi:Glutamate racemase [Acidisarcina polymorpha]|uniref:Glutamate racemase n=1 Tax=Acidisarcina polymorpha TaxID=2211140 RepID=A0A2Z5FS00_9BACT|nr:glutamate racemase [Acidisarcina polymorpha]AXC09502.1 Glutamate racemase [Acidisarcina polymorpha]